MPQRATWDSNEGPHGRLRTRGTQPGQRVAPLVDTADILIETVEVARILALAHRNSVSAYLKRYADCLGQWVDLGRGRPSTMAPDRDQNLGRQ
jgi:hypothetical protein